jgi:hypothetical protein
MVAVNLPSPSSVQAFYLARAVWCDFGLPLEGIFQCDTLIRNAFFPTLMLLVICIFSFVFSNSWWLYMRWCVTADVFLVDWRENWWSANGWSRNESCHKCAPWLIRVIWSSGEGRTSTGFVLSLLEFKTKNITSFLVYRDQCIWLYAECRFHVG